MRLEGFAASLGCFGEEELCLVCGISRSLLLATPKKKLPQQSWKKEQLHRGRG